MDKNDENTIVIENELSEKEVNDVTIAFHNHMVEFLIHLPERFSEDEKVDEAASIAYGWSNAFLLNVEIRAAAKVAGCGQLYLRIFHDLAQQARERAVMEQFAQMEKELKQAEGIREN